MEKLLNQNAGVSLRSIETMGKTIIIIDDIPDDEVDKAPKPKK